MAQVGRSNGKKRSTKEIPEEIREYYQAEKRDRMWVVWLMSGATFIVTVLVVLGLFWGGRWAYNKIKGDNKPAEQTATTDSQPNEQGEEQATQGSDSDSSDSSGNATAPSSDTTSPTPTPVPTPTPAPTTTPSTGETPTALVSTGPTSDE